YMEKYLEIFKMLIPIIHIYFVNLVRCL
ncbi:MAG: hypothetical protein ACI85O_002525, partial [Saprospiraceae bacterium]